MKKNRLIVAAFVVATAGSVFGAVRNARATLVAEYTLGEDNNTGAPVDTTGHHTFLNTFGPAPTVSSAHAPIGNSTSSLLFGGATGFYSTNNTDSSYPLNTTFTLDLWAKATNAGTNEAAGSLLAGDGANNGGVNFTVSGGNYVATVTGGIAFATGPAVTTNWTELTAIKAGGVTTFYVNGTSIGSTTDTAQGQTVHVGSTMHLGVTPGGSTAFAGNLDEVTVTNTPEPASMALIASAVGGLLIRRCRGRRAC